MAETIRYCKAFSVKRFQEFADWHPREQMSPVPAPPGNSTEESTVDAYWFLHDTYVVTRVIMHDEDVAFDNVSPQWIEFCRTQLGFSVPDDLRDEAASEEGVATAS